LSGFAQALFMAMPTAGGGAFGRRLSKLSCADFDRMTVVSSWDCLCLGSERRQGRLITGREDFPPRPTSSRGHRCSSIPQAVAVTRTWCAIAQEADHLASD